MLKHQNMWKKNYLFLFKYRAFMKKNTLKDRYTHICQYLQFNNFTIKI